MESSSADFSTILNRILDTAADNLRIAKILVQMGLDPNNITYDALFSGNVGAFFLYLLLLPINAIRLRQMLNLIKRARIATEGDTSLEWLKPFMTELRRVGKGALAPCPPSAIRIRAADGGHAIALPTLRATDKATIGASAEDRRDYKLLSRCKNTGMC